MKTNQDYMRNNNELSFSAAIKLLASISLSMWLLSGCSGGGTSTSSSGGSTTSSMAPQTYVAVAPGLDTFNYAPSSAIIAGTPWTYFSSGTTLPITAIASGNSTTSAAYAAVAIDLDNSTFNVMTADATKSQWHIASIPTGTSQPVGVLTHAAGMFVLPLQNTSQILTVSDNSAINLVTVSVNDSSAGFSAVPRFITTVSSAGVAEFVLIDNNNHIYISADGATWTDLGAALYTYTNVVAVTLSNSEQLFFASDSNENLHVATSIGGLVNGTQLISGITPAAIATDGTNLYVADTLSGAVQVYSDITGGGQEIILGTPTALYDAPDGYGLSATTNILLLSGGSSSPVIVSANAVAQTAGRKADASYLVQTNGSSAPIAAVSDSLRSSIILGNTPNVSSNSVAAGIAGSIAMYDTNGWSFAASGSGDSLTSFAGGTTDGYLATFINGAAVYTSSTGVKVLLPQLTVGSSQVALVGSVTVMHTAFDHNFYVSDGTRLGVTSATALMNSVVQREAWVSVPLPDGVTGTFSIGTRPEDDNIYINAGLGIYRLQSINIANATASAQWVLLPAAEVATMADLPQGSTSVPLNAYNYSGLGTYQFMSDSINVYQAGTGRFNLLPDAALPYAYGTSGPAPVQFGSGFAQPQYGTNMMSITNNSTLNISASAWTANPVTVYDTSGNQVAGATFAAGFPAYSIASDSTARSYAQFKSPPDGSSAYPHILIVGFVGLVIWWFDCQQTAPYYGYCETVVPVQTGFIVYPVR